MSEEEIINNLKIELVDKNDNEFKAYVEDYVSTFIGEYILKNIDKNIFMEGETKPIGLKLEKKINYDICNNNEVLNIKINQIPITEYETKYISRMEELKFDSEADKATFKERLQILFKGKVYGGKIELKKIL